MNYVTRATTEDSRPLLGTLQFDEDELSKPTQVQGRRLALGPVFVSVFLHVLGLYAILEHRIETPRGSTAASVAIHLQLVPPPQTRLPEPPRVAPVETEIAPESASTVPRPPEALTLPPSLVDLPQRPEMLVRKERPSILSPAPDTLAPTRLTVRQMVDKLRSDEERQAVMKMCAPQQKRNPMLLCSDEAASGFDDLQRDTNNVFFAATPENSQGLASATRVTRIANSLRESGMSQSDIDRYVEGIDVNAQQRSTSGDARATAVRDQMFRNDSTYQQMKRVMNPWP
jgi:hypothetical protein